MPREGAGLNLPSCSGGNATLPFEGGGGGVGGLPTASCCGTGGGPSAKGGEGRGEVSNVINTITKLIGEMMDHSKSSFETP